MPHKANIPSKTNCATGPRFLRTSIAGYNYGGEIISSLVQSGDCTGDRFELWAPTHAYKRGSVSRQSSPQSFPTSPLSS